MSVGAACWTKLRHTGLAIAIGALISACPARPASASIPYVLDTFSAYNVGCYDDCDCAVRTYPLAGTFQLRFVEESPLYTTYAVDDFKAVFERDGESVPVVGSGEYIVGGEVQVVNQLRLTLRIGDVEQSFDSGLTPGGLSFPGIKISVAVRGFACFDTVVDVFAEPSPAAVDRASLNVGLRIAPMPFREATDLIVSLPDACPIDIVIVDGQGRRVCTLARRAWLEQGAHRFRWNGRASDGTVVPPGIYFARVRWGGVVLNRSLIKLD